MILRRKKKRHGKDPAVEPEAELSFREWVRREVEAEKYWFQKIELAPELVTPGWSDPSTEKLPFFALPEDLTGMRVLDVGCAEGFFSFEAERRGAAEVISIDSYPDSVRRFNLCRTALASRATPFLCNVYDLNPKTFGTFDLVLFYGVLYHLRHPLLALEKILSVCTGTMLLQTATAEDEAISDSAWAKFHPHGAQSGPDGSLFDPTIFWLPNRECVTAMAQSAGFVDVEIVSTDPRISIVVRARGPVQSKGEPPDQTKAPWS